jgi:hypothetical protein
MDGWAVAAHRLLGPSVPSSVSHRNAVRTWLLCRDALAARSKTRSSGRRSPRRGAPPTPAWHYLYNNNGLDYPSEVSTSILICNNTYTAHHYDGICCIVDSGIYIIIFKDILKYVEHTQIFLLKLYGVFNCQKLDEAEHFCNMELILYYGTNVIHFNCK